MAIENQVQFYRGNKPDNLSNLSSTGIYFFEDTRELYVNGKIYGMSAEQAAELADIRADLVVTENLLSTLSSLVGTSETEGLRARLVAVEGKVVENANAASAAQSAAEAAQGAAEAAQSAAETAQNTADAAQGEIDALETFIGQLPENATATSVIDYINAKTEGVVTDTALTELTNEVSGLKTTVQEIQADYLGAEDRAELEEDIQEAVDAAIAAAGLASDAQAAAEAAQADIDAFMAAAEIGQDAIDTLQEIQTYITSDLAAADQMTKNIGANTSAIEELTGSVDGLAEEVKELRAIDEALDERVTSLEDLFGEGEGSVAEQIAAAVAEEAKLREEGDTAANAAIAAALKVAEEAKEVAEQGVADAAAAKSAADEANTAITALSNVVDGKVDTEVFEEVAEDVEANAQNISTMQGDVARIDALVAELDKVDHSHENQGVLDGISAAEVEKWNAAENNAKVYADSLLTWNAIG